RRGSPRRWTAPACRARSPRSGSTPPAASSPRTCCTTRRWTRAPCPSSCCGGSARPFSTRRCRSRMSPISSTRNCRRTDRPLARCHCSRESRMTVAEATPELDQVVDRADRAFLGHPTGLGYLAFVEECERFSYYSMQTLLVLYMVNYLLPVRFDSVAGLGWLQQWRYGG